MAKKRTKSKTAAPKPTFNPRDARPKPVLGLMFLVLSLLLFISLGDYEPKQNSFFSTDSSNDHVVGYVGMYIAVYSYLSIGLTAWLVPCFCLWASVMYFFSQAHKMRFWRYFSLGLCLLGTMIFCTMLEQAWVVDRGEDYSTNYFAYGVGGWVGDTLYRGFLHEILGNVGSGVIFGGLITGCVVYLFYDNLGYMLWAAAKRVYAWSNSRSSDKKQAKGDPKRLEHLREVQELKALRQRRRMEARADQEAHKAEIRAAKLQHKLVKKKRAIAAEEALPLRVPAEEAAPPPPARAKGKSKPQVKPPVEPAREPAFEQQTAPEPEPVAEPAPLPKYVAPEPAQPVEEPDIEPSHAHSGPPGLRIIAAEHTRKATQIQPKDKENYKFPPLSLLSEPADPVNDDTAAEYHQQTAEALLQTLGDFKVNVSMGEVHSGPVITRYDVYPAAGVRVEKIQNLDKNIALALKAMSVRILAPVPGKGCVGVEVPNKKPQSVFIRDILESEDWVNSKAEIPIALGKEVSGKPLIADLTKMPHLLIAGSTGSGKTVCINSVITSLLYKMSPEDVRFVMVDPKIVEMQVYNALPHMMIPVVTDPKKVPGALKYLINEMERRYHMFAKVGVRNIAGYNAKQAKGSDAREAEAKARELELSLSPEERAMAANATNEISVPRDLPQEHKGKLPYIICIVDELADLMMVAPADIETGIARLAQLARAAGIHLILATQRPSVNVITGVIKANLPSRIAFKVASKVDSRTILDGMGADQLIGRGDMLFLPPGSADLCRSQGAFVGDDEINGIVEWVSEQNGEPEFDEQFQRSVELGEDADEDDGGEDFGSDWGDDMVPKAIDVIRNSKRASTSMLQRRLSIGYNRAARIMEILEDKGLVGPENGSSPREILVDFDSLPR
ncbi:MAG: DNA translocase FtsK [Opitutales bacterium]|nr:DNA translocase FtsK [Opitutales bacterium]